MSARLLTYNGETLCIRGWAVKLNVNETSFKSRLDDGWSIEKAITTPFRGYKGSWEKRIDRAVENCQDMMMFRGYFKKENRIKAYKQLKKDYEYFKQQDQMRIAV